MNNEDKTTKEGYQGECKICGWVSATHETLQAAEEETAEHAGYCYYPKSWSR